MRKKSSYDGLHKHLPTCNLGVDYIWNETHNHMEEIIGGNNYELDFNPRDTTVAENFTSSLKQFCRLLEGIVQPLELKLPRNLFSFLSSASGFSAGELRRCWAKSSEPAHGSRAFPSPSS